MLFAIAVLPVLAMTAVVADVGMVHAKRQELQTGVEAAALASAARLAAGSSACTGYDAVISANVGSLNSLNTNCATLSLATNDVVTVGAEASTSLAFSQLLGRSNASITSTASVMVGPAGSAIGLRPIAICA